MVTTLLLLEALWVLSALTGLIKSVLRALLMVLVRTGSDVASNPDVL